MKGCIASQKDASCHPVSQKHPRSQTRHYEYP